MKKFILLIFLYAFISCYCCLYILDDLLSIYFIILISIEDFLLMYYTFEIFLEIFFEYTYLNFIFISDSIIYILKFIHQSRFFSSAALCFFSFIIFLFIVIVRIATPRFKIESLTKLGWTYGLLIILFCIILYFIGYHMF